MSDIFDKYHKQYDAWYDKHQFVFLSGLEAIKRVLPPGARGLEIGVGTGRFYRRKKRFFYYQTVSIFPDQMNSVEKPRKGFGKGGFVVIAAKKRRA